MRRSIEQLGDLRGKRVLVRTDLNVPLDRRHDHRRRPDPGLPVPTIQQLLGRRRAGDRLRAPRPAEGRAGPALLPGAGRRPARRAARPAGRLRRRHGRGVRPGGRRRAGRRRRRPAGEPPLQPGRDQQGRRRARRRSPTSWPRWPTPSSRDGFGVVHRKQASVYDVAQRLPHAAGGLVLAEVDVLRRLTEDPERPYAVVLGGSKVSDKLGVIDNLLGKADRLLIGGGMVFTFLAAQGHEVGKSLLEADQIDAVKGYLDQARPAASRSCCRPTSLRPTAFSADAEHDVVAADAIPADRMGLDIGPESAGAVRRGAGRREDRVLERPDGRLRDGAVRRGHPRARQALTEVDGLHRRRRRRLGRGRAHARLRRDSDFGHISTGGGASLEYLEGKTLPGLAVLEVSDGDPHPADGGQLEDEPQPPARPAHLVQKLAWTLKDAKHDFGAVEVAVLPPFTDLRTVQTLVDGDKLGDRLRRAGPVAARLGRLHRRDLRAMLAKLGCTYVVVGHSERREYHRRGRRAGERQGQGRLPARADADPVRRRGPGRPQGRRAGRVHPRPARPARWPASRPSRPPSSSIAYEPVWAIGTGEVATPEDAQEVCAAIRGRLAELFSPEQTARTRVLYGGSVKAATSPRSWPSPTSTAPWSAARAWTPRSSPRSAATRRARRTGLG